MSESDVDELCKLFLVDHTSLVLVDCPATDCLLLALFRTVNVVSCNAINAHPCHAINGSIAWQSLEVCLCMYRGSFVLKPWTCRDSRSLNALYPSAAHGGYG